MIPYLLNYGIGDEGVDPDKGLIEKYSEAAGEGVGAALPFIGAQAKLASAIKPTIEAAAPVTRRVIDALLRPFRNNPKKALQVEAALSALAGTGAELEEDLFGTQTGIGAVAVPVTTGIALPYTINKLTGVIGWGSRKAFDAFDNIVVCALDKSASKKRIKAK